MVALPAASSPPFFLHRVFPKRYPRLIHASSSIIAKQDAHHLPQVPLPAPVAPANQPPQINNVVIVGAGIAGMALALALHRLGVKSIVLEKAGELRTTGTAIGIWTNAWRALEALGVAEGLRKKFPSPITAFTFCAADGKCLTSLEFPHDSKTVELWAVERKVLLEALREPLPLDTVYFNVQVVGIKKFDGGYTEVQLQNGSTIQTKDSKAACILAGDITKCEICSQYACPLNELFYAIATQPMLQYMNHSVDTSAVHGL